VIDPLSVGGQRGLSLLELFREQLHFSFSVVLIPPLEVTQFPLEHFYRYVLSPQLPILSSSTESQQDDEKLFVGASFTNLPPQHVLTTRTDIPEPWNVQTMKAYQDIDNLRCTKASPAASGGNGRSLWKCGDVEQGDETSGLRQPGNRKKDMTEIGYNLKSLLVFGQCFEKSSSGVSAPNGLQLTLTPALSSSSVASDTLVMKNLGYYQLQVPFPSLYQLNLAVGKANDLYLIMNPDSRSSEDEDNRAKIVAVKSFKDVVHRLFVMKRPGKEHIPLLEESSSSSTGRARDSEEKEGGFWKNLKSSIFGQEGGVVKSEGNGDDDTIHVFSLATGHLYERFLRIMMLSVIKSTKSKVKFWLFENYLSPKFKEIAQVMMEQYHFEIGKSLVFCYFVVLIGLSL
jgi:UDP-glucose:glycoprotein glucosyltransferase